MLKTGVWADSGREGPPPQEVCVLSPYGEVKVRCGIFMEGVGVFFFYEEAALRTLHVLTSSYLAHAS